MAPLRVRRRLAATRPQPAVAPPAAAVLIVDDNEDAAAMLAEYVRGLGYLVHPVNDAAAALRAAQESAPAVALLDIGLPVMDGYELAGRLRDVPGGPRIKLVAITGYGQPTDRERSRLAGFDAHLVKPVDLDALEALLREFVEPD